MRLRGNTNRVPASIGPNILERSPRFSCLSFSTAFFRLAGVKKDQRSTCARYFNGVHMNDANNFCVRCVKNGPVRRHPWLALASPLRFVATQKRGNCSPKFLNRCQRLKYYSACMHRISSSSELHLFWPFASLVSATMPPYYGCAFNAYTLPAFLLA